MATLITAQILGGIGLATGLAVSALLAKHITGSETLAGLGTTAQILGGAVLSVPLAKLMNTRGRRVGLIMGYVIATVGSVLIIAAAVFSSFTLLMIGSILFGGATTANNQTRFAATDLASPRHVGRDLSIVVWATTIGSVAGPNLMGPVEPLGQMLGLPQMTGSFVFAILGFAASILVLQFFLRPDPLLTARANEIERQTNGIPLIPDEPSPTPETRTVRRLRDRASIWDGVRIISSHPQALLGLIVLAGGHAVMIGVMVMAPLHMEHGGSDLQIIGLIISIHIFGMFGLSPLVGMATDRFGGHLVSGVGAMILLGACIMAAQSHQGTSPLLTVSLFLLGFGWSLTLVTGSTLLTQSLALHERPATQGISDLVMGLAGGVAGAGAGFLLAYSGYGSLAMCGAGVSVLLMIAIVMIGFADNGDRPGLTHH
ncbi:MFS transporter [Austwickia sp. TVS 96-490-7B]|uniref:MFS transporter n=1 Tax=Austwickia sp. TVS 96-490-7B TaxID=2830843 RepID=UPI002104316B|nr:MFS transporter [Austwickia sp. TVS 96-490-7B]